jgi:hypothetical protein
MSGHPDYPGYDVLAKRDTPSWNDRTRAVIDARLATPTSPRFLTPAEWETADALCRRIVPGDVEVPLIALLDAKLLADEGDGVREDTMPYMREAWRRALAALDHEAEARGAPRFAALAPDGQDAILSDMQAGQLAGDHWRDLDPKTFFARRVLVDVPALFYALPGAWSEIGFGGPASPRGYVRLDGNRRDAWEAAEAMPGEERLAERENRHVV